MIRKDIFAGSWYPKNKQELLNMISYEKVDNPKVRFAVIPHAGLFYSSNLIKLFFSNLDLNITRLLILSPSHYYRIPNDLIGSDHFDSYETPLGSVKGFCLSPFEKGYKEVIQAEHAVEMALPFCKLRENLKVSTAIVNSFTSYEKALDYAKKIIKSIDENTAVVASSDFTHYGARFSYTPFKGSNPEKAVFEADNNIAQLFCSGQGEKAYETAKKNGDTICGLAPILVVSEIARLLKYEGFVAGHYNSNIINKTKEEDFVSYFCLLWRKDGTKG